MNWKGWIWQILIGLDRLVNAILGGSADETMSSYAHRMRAKRQPYWWWVASVIDKLFFWQEDHCLRSWEYEVGRRNRKIMEDTAGERVDLFDILPTDAP